MLNITFVNLTGFTIPQAGIITRSTEKGLRMIQDPLWRSTVKDYDFSENRGYSGDEVLDLIDAADLKIDVKDFHSFSNTIAYTFLTKFTTYFNDYYLNQFLDMPSIQGEAKVFSTVMHETMHQLGFVHRWFWDRSTTVPYGIQHITEEHYNLLVKS